MVEYRTDLYVIKRKTPFLLILSYADLRGNCCVHLLLFFRIYDWPLPKKKKRKENDARALRGWKCVL
jgi:hypothetical protein